MSEAAPRRRSWLWLQGLVCGAALTVATAPAVLITVLLAPGALAYVIEQEKGKPIAESMLLLGLATSFMPLRLLWEGGHSMEACLTLLSDPAHAGLAWVAAGAGWLMEEAARMIARQCSDASSRQRVAQLQKERAALVAEWGALDPSPPPGGRRR